MFHLRFKLLLPTLPIALMSLAPVPAAASGWTVSCSVGGTVVHVETLAQETAEIREREIRARYPTAACVFLSEPTVSAAPSQSLAHAESGPFGLEAALRAISGESLDVVFPEPPSPPEQNDEPVDAPAEAFPSAPDHRPETPGWIRLSMYRTENIADALGDWSRITNSEPSFRFLTPSVARVDERHVMLSVGPVTEAEKPAVCVAATSMGLECLSGPALDDGGNDLAIEYLAANFPGAVDRPAVEYCTPAPPLAEYEQVLPPGLRSGLTCWRSGFAADRVFAPFDPEAKFEVAAPTAAVPLPHPPLPRPRPVRSPV